MRDFPLESAEIGKYGDHGMCRDVVSRMVKKWIGQDASQSGAGKKLADFFNSQTEDWVNARRTINGLDHATKVAAVCAPSLMCCTGRRRVMQDVRPSWSA